ncbi:YhgE/Pip domain-containing protein [Pseudogracilibacillus sp. SO30301A]|uniref:YhgE/Pip domain-containing protein n=1 Tax=Pseudogracilibacillus sp. SO30301A TaxID=3098291 RepID=UPI00300E271E
MRNSWDVYKLDIKNITTNWVVAIIIGGLIILPSLYAWLNIKASWDPYAQTNQIPIGVVNEDKGALIRDQEVHVGDTLVDTLRKNYDFNWQFVDREKAMDEVQYGNYFAVIIVPENFSETLGTVIRTEPEKAQIEYYVNEKINAIAPKITEKGASVIVEQISSEFIATVNGIIFDMFNQIGIELEADLPDLKQFERYIFTLEEELPEVHNLLTSTSQDADEAEKILTKATNMIPKAKSMTASGLEETDKALELLNKAKNRLNEIGPKIEEDLKKTQATLNQVKELITGFQEIDIKQKRETAGNEIKDHINNSLATMQEVEQALSVVQESSTEENPQIANALEKITALKTSLQSTQAEIDGFGQLVTESEEKMNEVTGRITELGTVTSTNLDEFIQIYNEEIKQAVHDKLEEGRTTITQAKNMLTEMQSTIPKVEKLLADTSTHLGEGKGMLKSVLGEFPYINDKVKEVANRIRKLQAEADVYDIIQLLRNNPEAERGFFSEPVVLNKNELFPVQNYGTGMTPFYTVLSIWVGALLLISLLSTDIPHAEQIKPQEMYVGRMFTFITIGLLQTAIVTFGDIFFIGVGVSSKLWFILFGLFISIIFMLFVYTVVSIFGDVGKAIAIVLLVLQIAGSGGTYPVVLLPEFFQSINPFLPFTYAVDLMREAVGGIIWQRVFRDILFLFIFGVMFVLAGLFLKGPINKRLHKLLQSKGSRLFH